MKTLTTLTAIAALVAGMSIASAQMSPSGSTSPKPGVSGTTGSSSSPQAATGSGQFCIETSKGGGMNCKYASMAACEKDAKAQNLNCSPNPNKSTTGSKQ